MTHTKTCFFIAPIGDEGSLERKRSDQVLRHIVAPVVAKFGYEATRGDKIDKPGLITSQVIQGVLDSDLVVADLTDRNPNVFYELALRHAIKRPFIQMIEVGAKIPFDVSGLRTIYFDYQDLDSVEHCKTDLERQIIAVEANPGNVDSPVAVAIDYERLRSSALPVDQYILEAREFQTELVQRIYNLEFALGQLMTVQPSRFEYRQLPDGIWANVFVMPQGSSAPAVSLIDKNFIPSSVSSPPLNPEFLKKAMSAVRSVSQAEKQSSPKEKQEGHDK